MCCHVFMLFFFSSRRRHTRCALVTGVQTCALPIYLIRQADANPDVGIIGAEPFLSGVGRLLSYLDERPRPNVRVHADDVRPVLDRMPEACLSDPEEHTSELQSLMRISYAVFCLQ